MTARPLFAVALMLAILLLMVGWSLQPREVEGSSVVHSNGWACQYRQHNGKPLTICERGIEYVRVYGLRGDRLR